MALALPSIADVRAIITTARTDPQVTAAITDASLMVEQCPVIATMSTVKQQRIVAYVAAHLICMLDQGVGPGVLTSKALGDASESYASASMGGDGLKLSRYGQQALALDSSGCLASIGKRAASFRVLGGCP